MKLVWKPHPYLPGIKVAKHNGCSIIWAHSSVGREILSPRFEVMFPDGDTIRKYDSRKAMEDGLANLPKGG